MRLQWESRSFRDFLPFMQNLRKKRCHSGFYLKDSLTGVVVELLYTIFSEYGAIARSVRIKKYGRNAGTFAYSNEFEFGSSG